MSSVKVKPDVEMLLSKVNSSILQLKKIKEEERSARSSLVNAINEASNYFHGKASSGDELAEAFFNEEGFVFKGYLYKFDDEGGLTVVDGPLVVEVES